MTEFSVAVFIGALWFRSAAHSINEDRMSWAALDIVFGVICFLIGIAVWLTR